MRFIQWNTDKAIQIYNDCAPKSGCKFKGKLSDKKSNAPSGPQSGQPMDWSSMAQAGQQFPPYYNGQQYVQPMVSQFMGQGSQQSPWMGGYPYGYGPFNGPMMGGPYGNTGRWSSPNMYQNPNMGAYFYG